MPEGIAIALLTCDLRMHDSPVLHAAAAHPGTVPVFVLDEAIHGGGLAPPNRSAFLADCLDDLDASLRARGSRLVVLRGDTATETARLAHRTGAAKVHVAAAISGFGQRREVALREALGDRLTVHEAVATTVAPGEVLPAGKDHYAVYGAYFRQWALVPRREPFPAPSRLNTPEQLGGLALDEVRRQLTAHAAAAPELAPGGETHGRRKLWSWTDTGLDGYAEGQDDLAGDHTSRLSPYLHFGCVSATEVAQIATSAQSPGTESFLRQLAWRDFHHQLLAARPDAGVNDYRSRGDHWRHDEAELEAWRQGRTGYPIVDAGMRQLLREGWMHNRARMFTASFLTKTLYQDWRAGAAHFNQHLLDADVANNQLNWQWVAGTGTDTRPNRVLNPLRQAQRFDADGSYVRRWVPELASVNGSAVHRPWQLPAVVRAKLDYPEPMVDLNDGLARFRLARGL
ncbi:deoxyribodipyrimidine photo-lyase [Streptacidiphilus sp. N1-3]|uniref:Deoxyribodipyrimidine photo-lyase n=1 Tax=Streptacidiphilus alkalitolerans TaxID=3342712 RepID=A0ABV6X5Z3_9ACTN